MRIPVHTLGGVTSATYEGVARALASVGLEPAPSDQWPPEETCLLLYSCPEDAISKHLKEAREAQNHALIALSVSGKRESAAAIWGLLNAGASDVLYWSGESCATEVAARLRKRIAIERYLSSHLIRDNLIGRSVVWMTTLEQLVEAAAFTHEAVLLSGESGTGKELAARLIHALDQRTPKKDLVVVDCTTLIPELAGSELFGHERGAYTGAVGARVGAIEMAHEGTLFLDEIGELSLALQAQLLRVIQEKTYKRVGGNQWHTADFRLVSATNRDLRAMVEQGSFRRDLYYRIASVPVTLPPLRERPEDIIPLVRHFLREMSPPGSPEMLLDPALEAYFISREYPGNVRDLRQLIARILHRHCGTAWISPASLPEQERPEAGDGQGEWPDQAFLNSVRRALANGIGLQEIAREAKESALHLAMDLEAGSVKRAAERLGVTERAIQMRRAKGPGTAGKSPPSRAESA